MDVVKVDSNAFSIISALAAIGWAMYYEDYSKEEVQTFMEHMEENNEFFDKFERWLEENVE